MVNKISGITIRFITYSEISRLNSQDRIKKILDIILENKIIVLQGRLESVEETSLIQSTMALAGRVKGFKGVELAVLNPDNDQSVLEKFRFGLAKAIVGNTSSLTIIGPATVVKQIKIDPSRLEFMSKK